DEMMMDRSSKKVSYVDNEGVEGTLWVDKYYGIPLRKEYYVGEDRVIEDFDDFTKGGVTEEMVTAPSDLVIR
ncbi:hypothetical protein KY345_05960, partial [Candidatus Woesearchaeota archaeon]|nr:hypothetical protein [Candidatus Woesearchaeota archaeon]